MSEQKFIAEIFEKANKLAEASGSEKVREATQRFKKDLEENPVSGVQGLNKLLSMLEEQEANFDLMN